MHMYGLSIQIGKGLWTQIWIQKFIIVVDLKIIIFLLNHNPIHNLYTT